MKMNELLKNGTINKTTPFLERADHAESKHIIRNEFCIFQNVKRALNPKKLADMTLNDL